MHTLHNHIVIMLTNIRAQTPTMLSYHAVLLCCPTMLSYPLKDLRDDSFMDIFLEMYQEHVENFSGKSFRKARKKEISSGMLWRVKLQEKEAGLSASQRSTNAIGEPKRNRHGHAAGGQGAGKQQQQQQQQKKKKKQQGGDGDDISAREAAIAQYRLHQRLQKQKAKMKSL